MARVVMLTMAEAGKGITSMSWFVMAFTIVRASHLRAPPVGVGPLTASAVVPAAEPVDRRCSPGVSAGRARARASPYDWPMLRGARFDIPIPADLLAFESVARLGSFSRAAEELETSQSAVSRHIARLERRFSQRLFERARAGTRPTRAGERPHAGISAGLDTIRDGIVKARSAAASGEWAVIAYPAHV